MSARQTQLALIAILALAAFLRLFQLTTVPPPLHFDEAMNGNEAMENVELGRMMPFYAQNGGREGLYINIETALIYLFSPEAWMLRLPAAIFGVLTVWGIYLLAADLFSVPIALLAAFFTATSFWHILFSRLGLRAIAAPLFAVWTLHFLIGSLRRSHKSRPYLAQAVVSGLLFGLGFYTYIAYRVAPAFVLVALIYGFVALRGPSFLKLVSAFAATAAVTVTPLALYFIKDPEMLTHRSAEVSIFHAANPSAEFLGNVWKTIQMIFTRGDMDWHFNIAYRAVVFWPVAILFAIGLVLSIRALVRRQDWFPHALLLTWVFVGAVPAVLSTEGMPSAIRSILMIPPIFMLAANAAWQLYRWIVPRAPAQILPLGLAIVILALTYEAYHSYFDVWARDPNVPTAFDAASVDIANRVNALPKTAPKYIVPVTPGAGYGVPTPAQTIMFLTQSYTEKQRRDANIQYILHKPTDAVDGIDFCRQVAIQYRENVFCLEVRRLLPPKF